MGKYAVEQKVLFVIWGLSPGGAERVFVNIVNGIGPSIRPILVVLGKKEGFADELKEDLEVYFLNKKSRWDVFRLLKQLGSIMREKQPDCVLSFGYYANQLVVLANRLTGSRIPICINERTETFSSLQRMNFKIFRQLLLRMTYRMANKVVVVSEKTKETLIDLFNIDSFRITVIYNPVDLEKIKNFSIEEVHHPWFNERNLFLTTAVGRLNKPKGFDILIRAFAKVIEKKENARLAIIGEGEERANLEELIQKLGMSQKATLLGYQKNPYKFLARSNVFVLSSLYEGFPNVVLEAMACGLPVIATRCPSGPEEIITDEINGLLVPVNDEQSLFKAILRLAEEEDLSAKLVVEGKKRVQDFPLIKIVKKYEETLLAVINHG